MDANSLIKKAEAYKQKMNENFAAMSLMAPMLIASEVRYNDGDAALNRVLASKASLISKIASSTDVREWAEGMTTNPGDMVYDPEGNYVYIYTGSSAMTHINPLFYPGSAGVYYWSVIPNTLDGVKVYPDISGIIVAVKHGEPWWNVDKTAIYTWNGADNDSCVWPPADGNEWTKISSVDTE